MKELEKIKTCVRAILNGDGRPSAYLYCLNQSPTNVGCSKYQLALEGDAYSVYLDDLRQVYLGDERGREGQLDEFDSIVKWDGSDFGDKLQYRKKNDRTISEVWNTIDGAEVCVESNWTKHYAEIKKPKGLMIEKKVEGDLVTLILSASPIWELKHGWMFIDGRFKVVQDCKMLTLPTRIDIIRIADRVYYLTKQGWSLDQSKTMIDQDRERTLDGMAKMDKIGDFKDFRAFASKGVNKRRMIRFNKDKFIQLADVEKGKKIRDLFGIEFKGGKLEVPTSNDKVRLIKIVCDHGMTDPFTKHPMEVSGAREWTKK